MKDSLIPCKWYKDSIINSKNYLEYVINYIQYFELPRVEYKQNRDSAYFYSGDSAFFYYAYYNTKGSLREQLCSYQLRISNSISYSNFLKEFEDFKKIASNKEYIKEIEEKITRERKKN